MIEIGSKWRAGESWRPGTPHEITVRVVTNTCVAFNSVYIMSRELFLECYEPLPDVDTETPAMDFGGEE